jgi:hypothetical protein
MCDHAGVIAVEFDAPADAPAEVTGFELGHVGVRWDDGTHSSRDLGPRGLLLVYPAATHMLDGVVTMLSHPDGSYLFDGVSSSWGFAARRTRRHGVHLTTLAGTPLCQASEADYAIAVWRATRRLLAARTPVDGAPFDDLRAAMRAYPAEYRR